MPYLTLERIRFLEAQKEKAVQEGDWNYLYTLELIATFLKAPKYKTIHLIKKACYVNSQWVPGIKAIDDHLRKINIPAEDIVTARQLACDEFYRRVASLYEDSKIALNGDVYEGLLKKVFPSVFGINDLFGKGEIDG